MNPFGATVGPPQGYGAPPPAAPYGAPPQAAPYGAPPQAAPYGAPPQAAPYGAPPPAYPAPPPGWGAPQEQPPAQAWQPPGASPAAPPVALAHGSHSKDPSAFAATAPPPTNEEFDRLHQHNPAAPPPPAYAPPPQPAPLAAPSAPPPAVAAPVAPAPSAVDTSLRVLSGFLVSYETTELGVFWPIYQGQNVVGRKGAAPGLDIEIDHPTTSSRHAVIHATARPGKLRVEDPGSTNGTFLGEHMIEKNKSHDLRDGEAVRFGGFNVIVKII